MNNMTLQERMQYNSGSFSQDELIELMAELDAWRSILENINGHIDTPEDMNTYVQELEEQSEQCNNEEHKDYDDLKEFFNDCVEALNQYWPCPEAYDPNLREVITNAISKGDNEEVM